jgi:hypothetical protein
MVRLRVAGEHQSFCDCTVDRSGLENFSGLHALVALRLAAW